MAEGDAATLLRAHKQAIEAALAANRAHQGDAAGLFLLAGLTARLERLLKAVGRDLVRPLVGGPFGTAGRWGPNGRAPEIADLIDRSARARRVVSEAEPRPPPARRAA